MWHIPILFSVPKSQFWNFKFQWVSCSYSYPEKRQLWQWSSVTNILVVTFKQPNNVLQRQKTLQEICNSRQYIGTTSLRKVSTGTVLSGNHKCYKRNQCSGWEEYGRKAWENTIVKIFTVYCVACYFGLASSRSYIKTKQNKTNRVPEFHYISEAFQSWQTHLKPMNMWSVLDPTRLHL